MDRKRQEQQVFLKALISSLHLLPGTANSICSSKCRLQKQGRNAAIVPSYQYLAICGLHSSCAETVPTGLTTLLKFSLNHFSNNFNFWDECNNKLQERTFFALLKKAEFLTRSLYLHYEKLKSITLSSRLCHLQFYKLPLLPSLIYFPSGNKKQSAWSPLQDIPHSQSSLLTSISRRQQRAKLHIEHVVSL